jgi:hypothetical protein
MFIKLSAIEIKYQLKSVTFYVFVLLTALFVFSQMGSFESWSKHPNATRNLEQLKYQIPERAASPVDKEVETQKGVYELLSRAASTGKIIVARGFINKKEVLSDKQLKLIRDTMQKISPGGKSINSRSDLVLSNEVFEKIIDELDDQLGGHTVFAKERREGWIAVPKSYEELVAEEKRVVELGFTPLVAQMFADYYGIALAMLTVFLAAFIFYRDKRSHILELVCSRSVSGYTYIFSKFAGTCIPVFASITAVAAVPTFFAVKMKMEGYEVKIFTYFSTFAVWLFPTVMFIAAAAMLVSLLVNNPIPAFAAQFFFFVISVAPLQGDYSLYKVFIRHNVMEPLANPQAFYINRVFIALMSVIFILVTAGIWEARRRRIGECIK